MLKIYHNPRCSKSREGLAILEASGKTFEVIKYLNDHFTAKTLSEVITLLEIDPIDLVRKNESIWKEEYKHLNLTPQEVVDAMVKHPKLIERPIVTNKDKAVIGRPPESIKQILNL
ncbi:arsenate reductase (glutaredoxin) [Lacinutrix sp. Hel_I_90]|uniref:arsenate reductase (glutaredoxin) n=1 Tax=Lacinutrix sp. Hel_I_90 TaxID=1249999 RepID=UPI0005C933EA|nr:arsenate reductase (glutaredoxin) [Lacinutrix sp. Hel_I_90]